MGTGTGKDHLYCAYMEFLIYMTDQMLATDTFPLINALMVSSLSLTVLPMI